MKRESFIFYKSFYDSIKELDLLDQAQIYNAIFQYQFEEEKIELTGICKSIFTLIIPQLEANNKRYKNGLKGGAPKNNQNARKKQPKNNLETTKKQPNENENENVNVNDNENNNMNIIINNWEEHLTCDEINKTNNERCERRSTYNINGKNYCNQHSKSVIKKLLEYNENFKKPTIDEIKDYCNERNNNIDPERFFDFYESKDWMIGKNKMKDWKSAVRTWEKSNKSKEVIPSWFNKEIKKDERTEDEERQLQELIRGN